MVKNVEDNTMTKVGSGSAVSRKAHIPHSIKELEHNRSHPTLTAMTIWDAGRQVTTSTPKKEQAQTKTNLRPGTKLARPKRKKPPEDEIAREIRLRRNRRTAKARRDRLAAQDKAKQQRIGELKFKNDVLRQKIRTKFQEIVGGPGPGTDADADADYNTSSLREKMKLLVSSFTPSQCGTNEKAAQDNETNGRSLDSMITPKLPVSSYTPSQGGTNEKQVYKNVRCLDSTIASKLLVSSFTPSQGGTNEKAAQDNKKNVRSLDSTIPPPPPSSSNSQPQSQQLVTFPETEEFNKALGQMLLEQEMSKQKQSPQLSQHLDSDGPWQHQHQPQQLQRTLAELYSIREQQLQQAVRSKSNGREQLSPDHQGVEPNGEIFSKEEEQLAAHHRLQALRGKRQRLCQDEVALHQRHKHEKQMIDYRWKQLQEEEELETMRIISSAAKIHSKSEEIFDRS